MYLTVIYLGVPKNRLIQVYHFDGDIFLGVNDNKWFEQIKMIRFFSMGKIFSNIISSEEHKYGDSTLQKTVKLSPAVQIFLNTDIGI